jgi:hypothetical protein
VVSLSVVGDDAIGLDKVGVNFLFSETVVVELHFFRFEKASVESWISFFLLFYYQFKLLRYSFF